MWRVSGRKARCLVPALEWYEWQAVDRVDPATGEVKKVKQPYYIQRADDEPIAFAGFMSQWVGEFSCTILTRDAVGPAAAVHIRMPIALPKMAEAAWLDPDFTDAALAMEFAREQAMTAFVLGPVSMRVNNARNEGADLIEPFPTPV